MAEALGWRNWANLLAYVVNLGMTYGSLTGIFGQTNTELSQKYQTLVTPAGYAFSIWGPIFIWEGVFAVAQMFPSLRSNQVINAMTPWWIAACIFQCCWTVSFAREWIFISFWCMVGILLSLLGGILRTDLQSYSNKEFWLLRAPFSLHGGWIVAASAVNFCVLADSYRASPEVMLAFAMMSFCAICSIVALMTFAAPRPDAIIGLVACWALAGVRSELSKAENLRRPTRFNFYDWPEVDLAAVRLCASVLSIVCLCLAVVATLKRIAPRKSSTDAFENRALRV